MDRYCRYCGKELTNGKCECESTKIEWAKPTEMKLNVIKLWNLLCEIIKNPIEFVETASDKLDKKKLLVIGAGHVGLIFLLVLSGMPSSGWLAMEAKEKFKIAFVFAMGVLIIQLMLVAIIWGINKIFKLECEFTDILSIFCVPTIILSVGYVLVWLVFCFCDLMGIILLLSVIAGGIVLIYETVCVCTRLNRGVCFWILVVVVGFISLIMFGMGKEIVSNLLENALKSVLMF